MALTAAEVLRSFRATGASTVSGLGSFAQKMINTRTGIYAGADSLVGGILPGGVPPGTTAKVAAIGAGLYGIEQIAERLGVRGGAGFVGARPKKRTGYGIISKRAMKRIRKIHRDKKAIMKAARMLGLHYKSKKGGSRTCQQ